MTALACALAAACTVEAVESAPTAAVTSTTTTSTTTTTTTVPTTTSTTTSSTTTSTTTASTTTSTSTTTTTTLPPLNPAAPALRAAFGVLRSGNAAASLTVLRDGAEFVRLAAGAANDGSALTTDSPMVVASVSKLVTATTVSRLVQAGLLAVDQPVPWAEMGFAADPAWATVTVRDLLDHTSGIPIARKSWLDDPGSCAGPLGSILAGVPGTGRGTWVYSNGNYCALGLLIEFVTGERYDATAYRLVLAPAGVEGAHLTVDGAWPGDAPYAKGVARFDRLGGAGQWVVSTDDVATFLRSITEADRDVLRFPGTFVDQYGWGHTGSVDGAVSCAWVIEDGRTVVSATVAGGRPGSGGGVCDLVLPAAAADLGLPFLGEPVRRPE